MHSFRRTITITTFYFIFHPIGQRCIGKKAVLCPRLKSINRVFDIKENQGQRSSEIGEDVVGITTVFFAASSGFTTWWMSSLIWILTKVK